MSRHRAQSSKPVSALTEEQDHVVLPLIENHSEVILLPLVSSRTRRLRRQHAIMCKTLEDLHARVVAGEHLAHTSSIRLPRSL